jgi:hypothetical protein
MTHDSLKLSKSRDRVGASHGLSAEEKMMRSAGIELCPMTGWSAARLPGRNVMVELEYVETLEELRRGSQHVLQLAMTIERATGLIEALQQAITAAPSRQITASGRN